MKTEDWRNIAGREQRVPPDKAKRRRHTGAFGGSRGNRRAKAVKGKENAEMSDGCSQT